MNLNIFLIIAWILTGIVVILDKIIGEEDYDFVWTEFILCWIVLMIQLFKGV